jgi:hypothetical protein
MGLDIKLQTPIPDYARVLRAIGQDLEDEFPDPLEIEVIGKNFIAQGRLKPPRKKPAANGKEETGWRKTWHSLLRRDPGSRMGQPTPLFLPFKRTYTFDDANRLEDVGVLDRKENANKPDVYGLAEKLRVAGGLVNAKGGRLVKLINDAYGIVVQYLDGQGTLHLAEYSTFDIFKIQQKFVETRDLIKAIDCWRKAAS